MVVWDISYVSTPTPYGFHAHTCTIPQGTKGFILDDTCVCSKSDKYSYLPLKRDS